MWYISSIIIINKTKIMKKAINILKQSGFQLSQQWEDGIEMNKPGLKIVVTKLDNDIYDVSQYEFHNGYTTSDYFEVELEGLEDFG